MIKNYNLFLLENIKLSSSDVIDIIKSLSTDDKNSKLVNKLVNYTDNNGKTILMDLVQKNKSDLVDYILKFNIDINHKDKKNQNVLFYCKNVNMFNKFYYMGADSTLINTDGNNILEVLSSKKIFNVDLYKKLIGDGVDINKKNNIVKNSIFNQKILELLISKNVNLQDSEVQNGIILDLLYKFKYYPKDRKMIINKFKYLFDNGMKVNDKSFAKSISDELSWSYVGIDMVEEFIVPMSEYLTDDFFKNIIKNISNQDIMKKIMYNFPHYYGFFKQLYGDSFAFIFSDFLKEHPYIVDADKYNL